MVTENLYLTQCIHRYGILPNLAFAMKSCSVLWNLYIFSFIAEGNYIIMCFKATFNRFGKDNIVVFTFKMMIVR